MDCRKICLGWISVALTVIAAGRELSAQSLCRLTAPGGRQFDLGWGEASIEAFAPNDRDVLVLIGDGLVPGDSNGRGDLAWYDRWTGGYTLAVSGLGGAPTNGDPIGVETASISSTGRFFSFASTAANLTSGDTNGCGDVFAVDRQTGAVVRASLGTGGVQGNAESNFSDVSADGRYVAFQTEASNLGVLGGPAGAGICLRDTMLGVTRVVSHAFDGSVANALSTVPRISADGRFVVYLSQASNLVPGDTNGNQDAFLYDAQTDTNVRVNLGPGGIQDDSGAYYMVDMSPDAHWIVFDSAATNLHPVATDGQMQIYRVDRTMGSLEVVSVNTAGQVGDGSSVDPKISDDGRLVAFISNSTNLDPVDSDWSDDMFVHDTSTGVTRMVSVSSAGFPGVASGNFGFPVLSPSGRLAGFWTCDLGLVAGDTNWGDVFISDSQSTCPPIESYCTPKINSLGCTPLISSGGEPYISGPSDSFFLSAHGVREFTAGALIWSMAPAATPFAGGTLCVSTPFARTAVQDSGTKEGQWLICPATYSFHMSRAYMAAHGIGPSTTIYAQFWSRDSGFAWPNNVALTDGLRFTTSP
jgi:hypothetical protein